MSFAMRSSVQSSVAYPCNRGPFSRACSTFSNCLAFSFGGLPERPRESNPSSPFFFHAVCQAFVVAEETEKCRATHAWVFPSRNSCPAFRRRRSNCFVRSDGVCFTGPHHIRLYIIILVYLCEDQYGKKDCFPPEAGRRRAASRNDKKKSCATGSRNSH